MVTKKKKKRKTYLVKVRKGKLPSKTILERYYKLRKAGLSPKLADKLSRVKRKKAWWL